MTGRRSFLKNFLANAYVIGEEARGEQRYKLSELPEMEESRFKELFFRLREGSELQYNKSDIYWIKNEEQNIKICDRGTLNEQIFGLILERLSIREIAGRISPEYEESEESEESIYAKIRELILFLVKIGLCVPAASHSNENINK